MKVLHVISDRNIGGAGVLLLSLLKNFDRTRVESTVALPRGSALCERIAALSVPMIELERACDRFSLSSVQEIRAAIELTHADILHANAALCARIAGKRAGVSVLHTRHCCFPPRGMLRLRPIRAIGGLCNAALSDHVIATAEAAATDLRILGIPQKKISVIPNGSEEVRAVSQAERAATLAAWDLCEEDFTIGICARLVPCKGHEIFLRAAKIVLEEAPERRFRFLIAGEGELRGALERLAAELGIAHAVRFLGFLADPAPFYRLLRVNVNCSMGTETSCLALSEGMSAGVPMVISDYGGNPAMLGASDAGILFPAGNAAALAEALLAIAQAPDKEADMRRAARARYLSHYTAIGMTEALTRVYERLIK